MRRSTVAPRNGKAKLTKARTVARSAGLTAPSCTASCTTKKPSRKRREAAALPTRSDDTALISSDDKENATGNADEYYAAAECRRLREQLERALVDRERQEDEVVALRALAKSLKEEVEAIQRHSIGTQSAGPHVRDGTAPSTSSNGLGRSQPHEFFKLDIQVEELRAENAALREQLDSTTQKYTRIRTFVDRELRVHQLAAVKAAAELQSATSQLMEEQAQCDRLRAQVARYKARGDEPVRFSGLLGASEVVNDSKRQLARAREELLLQCLSDERDHHQWLRSGGSEPMNTVTELTGSNQIRQPPGDGDTCVDDAPSRRSAGSGGSTGANTPPREEDKLELLGDDVAALETQLRGLHASLELTRSVADDSGDVGAPQLSVHSTLDREL